MSSVQTSTGPVARTNPALLSSADSGSGIRVQRGDTLSGIAERHGVSLAALLAANPQVTNPDRIDIGQHLNLPTSDTQHVVRPGDTLGAIAARHGVSVESLARANQITNPNLIFPGDLLRVPASGGTAPAAPTGTIPPASTTRPSAQPTTQPTTQPSAPAGTTATPPPADGSNRVAPGRLPDTRGLNEAQRYDLYAARVQQFGSAEAKADLAAGRNVILSLRVDTDTRINRGHGAYDDRMVVLRRDADGSRHATELRANTEPSGEYEDGGPYTRRAIGGNYGGDSRGDQGRLVDGTYAFTQGRFLNNRALMAGSDQVTDRDTNHNGRFDDNVRTSRGGYGMHVHIGGVNKTGSAGCMTLPPDEHARLFAALGGQNTVRSVVVNTSRLTPTTTAAAPPPAVQTPAPATPPVSTAPVSTTGLPPVSNPAHRGPTEGDWQRAATTLGVDVAAIKAVAQVEAPGGGFLADGRTKILFEAHQFSARTDGRYDRSNPGISSARWDRSLYQGGAAEYPRLQQAMALNNTAALESASWGRFQIMGFNHEAAGYGNVQDFVQAMSQNEGKQLDAFVSFIRADSGMHNALRSHDWAGFAYRYNGEGYAANNYDTRMADAYRQLTH